MLFLLFPLQTINDLETKATRTVQSAAQRYTDKEPETPLQLLQRLNITMHILTDGDRHLAEMIRWVEHVGGKWWCLGVCPCMCVHVVLS